MATKTTGAEFKRFYNDKQFWPDDGGDTYHDDAVLKVDGEYQEDGIDTDTLADTAVVTIEGGFVCGPALAGKEPSLEAYFKRWRKGQTIALFLVECDTQVIDAVKAAIRAAGGRVI